MAEGNKRKRKVWSRTETLGLIKCYTARKDEFLHSRKKKFVYENVLRDMISQNLTDSSTTAHALEGKMYTLCTAYRAANGSREIPARIAPYMSELDELFQGNPNIFTMPTHNVRHNSTESPNEHHQELPHFGELEFFKEEVSNTSMSNSQHRASSMSPTSTISASSSLQSLQSYNDKRLQLKREEIEAKFSQSGIFQNNERNFRSSIS